MSAVLDDGDRRLAAVSGRLGYPTSVGPAVYHRCKLLELPGGERGAAGYRKMRLDRKGSRRGGMSGFLLVSALLATDSVAAQEAATAAAAITESQREAATVLQSMADYLAGLESFRCTTANGYETVQANGQKVEFGETRDIFLSRPSRLRLEEVSSDGVSDLTLFDGKQITMVSAGFNVYAQAPQPPSLEDALVYFVRDLRMRAPLALLLSTHVRTDLPALAQSVEYVERTRIDGKDAHHVAAQSESVDFEFWIAEGKKPLPLRVVITYKTAPGQPRFWADISNWKTNRRISAKAFELELPEAARQIPFAVQLSALGATPPVAASGEVTP